MEAPLTTGQFFELAALIGLPVHLCSCLVASLIARRRQVWGWARILALIPVWFVASVILQVFVWSVLPDLPEGAFMLLGFLNTPALLGNAVLLGIFFLVPRKYSRPLSASSA
jgi:hypothetical protein